MPRELPPNAFPDLTAEYLKEGKSVVSYREWRAGDRIENPSGLPQLETSWVYTALTNGTNHA